MSPCGRTETVSTWLPSVRFGVGRRRNYSQRNGSFAPRADLLNVEFELASG